MIYQNTIAKEVEFEGVGLHTGAYTKLKIIPAKPNEIGICSNSGS